MTKKLTKEDRDLFRQAVGKVHSVKNDKADHAGLNKPKPFPMSHKTASEGHYFTAAHSAIPVVAAEDEISFAIQGLDKGLFAKLRQGNVTTDAEIDLHGLNSAEARRELFDFLHECVRSGCGCIQVVHGKGYRSSENHPILKNNINIWLRQHPDVRAFCSATPRDGGAGAVYVLLRRAWD